MSAIALNPTISYKEQQRLNTQKEIENILAYGCERISLEDMQNRLSKIGLTLDLNPNGLLLAYYNTSNDSHFFCATTSPLDKDKISAYNIKSEFYNKHLKGEEFVRDEYAQELHKLRTDYFCTYTKRGIEYILSF
jgi:hypothetical protein